jgi:hypothetical protein
MPQSTLPHYTQNRAAINKYEPVQPNLFEVTVLTPLNHDASLILEHVRSIGGLNNINPSVDPVVQKFKWADRSYAGMPSQTFVDLTITFTLNLNDSNEMYIYKMMRDWYKLTNNPSTGEQGLKVDYAGSLIVVQYNKRGDIFRELTFRDVFPQGQPDMMDELNYDTQDAAEITMTFRSDHWEEITV